MNFIFKNKKYYLFFLSSFVTLIFPFWFKLLYQYVADSYYASGQGFAEVQSGLIIERMLQQKSFFLAIAIFSILFIFLMLNIKKPQIKISVLFLCILLTTFLTVILVDVYILKNNMAYLQALISPNGQFDKFMFVPFIEKFIGIILIEFAFIITSLISNISCIFSNRKQWLGFVCSVLTNLIVLCSFVFTAIFLKSSLNCSIWVCAIVTILFTIFVSYILFKKIKKYYLE